MRARDGLRRHLVRVPPLSRTDPVPGLVHLRQTFVFPCHRPTRSRSSTPARSSDLTCSAFGFDVLRAAAPSAPACRFPPQGMPFTLAARRSNASLALPWRSGGEAGGEESSVPWADLEPQSTSGQSGNPSAILLCSTSARRRQWKAAAFARWHQPDDPRVSSPVL